MADGALRAEEAGLDVGPWLAYSSPEHNGRLFWTHRVTGQRTWAQPLPPTAPLKEFADAADHPFPSEWQPFLAICRICTVEFGSSKPAAKTISGCPPSIDLVVRCLEQIGPAYALYSRAFPSNAGMSSVIFCSKLHYGGQRRGHVPSFHSKTMYIDCMPQPKRRAVSSFHHELWHFADYTMLGRDYEFGDAEW